MKLSRRLPATWHVLGERQLRSHAVGLTEPRLHVERVLVVHDLAVLQLDRGRHVVLDVVAEELVVRDPLGGDGVAVHLHDLVAHLEVFALAQHAPHRRALAVLQAREHRVRERRVRCIRRRHRRAVLALKGFVEVAHRPAIALPFADGRAHEVVDPRRGRRARCRRRVGRDEALRARRRGAGDLHAQGFGRCRITVLLSVE
jgi:hypothetical protein